MDGVGDGGTSGSVMGAGRSGFSVAEVGRGGRERTVGAKPGTRRTTSLCEPLSMNGTTAGEGD